MTAKTLCLANQKGGPGKTTTTHNLSVQLARSGKKILAIDIDGQGNLSTLFDITISESERTISDLLIHNATAKSLITPTKIKNLDIITSNRNTYFAEKELANKSGREFILSDALDEVRPDYDFILIDTPPNLGLLTFSSIVAANYLIIVTSSNELSLNGIADLLETVGEIKANKRININDTQILGVVHNDFKAANKRVNRYAEEELNQAVNSEVLPRVFKSKIRSTTEIENAQIKHLPIFDFVRKHAVIDDYKNLAREILECLN